MKGEEKDGVERREEEKIKLKPNMTQAVACNI